MKLEEFEVVLLDIDRINEAVDAFVKADPNISAEIKENSTFSIRPSKLCYTINDKGVIGVFDPELCGRIIDMEEGKYPIEIFKRTHKEGGDEIGILPEFETAIPVVTLMTDYCIGMVKIPEFMGTRYNYNTRIQDNQKEFINFIKGN